MITHRFSSILGDVPPDWETIELRDALKDHAAGDWGSDSGELRADVVRSTNFRRGRGADFSDVATRWFTLSDLGRLGLNEGDILIERSGGSPTQPVGRVVRVGAALPFTGYSNFVHRLRVNDELMNPDFVAWCLFHLHASGIVERFQHQTTQMRNLDFRDYLRLRLPRPPRQVQDQTAATLSSLERAQVLTGDEVCGAQAQLAALRESLIADGLRPGTRGIHKTPVGCIPNDWDVVELRKLADVGGGVTLNKDRAPARNAYRYITVENVHRDRIEMEDVRYLELLPSEVPRKLIEEGDILVVEGHANRSEIGRAAIAGADQAGLTHQNHLFKVRRTSDRVSDRFLLLALNARYARRHWAAVSNTSSGLSTINSRELRRLPVPVPSPPEQEAIVALVDAAKLAVRAARDKALSLRALEAALRGPLLTGQRLSQPALAS